MAAVENRAEGPSGPAPTNLVELPKLAPRPRRRPRLVRLVLLVLVPLIAVVIAGSFYLAGGRYVSTDDAYARAPIMNVTNEIAGIVKEVDVRSHQQVATGDMLFRLDDQPYIIALAGAEAQLAAVRNELVSLKSTYRQNLSQVEQAKGGGWKQSRLGGSTLTRSLARNSTGGLRQWAQARLSIRPWAAASLRV